MNPNDAYSVPSLGATVGDLGAEFALYSGHADAVDLCLFDRAGDARESRRVSLARRADGLWHGHVNGVRAGQHYGYRVHGPFAPRDGHRFNPAKLLLDPYARAVSGPTPPDDCLLGSVVGSSLNSERPDDRDSAAAMPKCVVTDSRFDWRGDAPPRTPWDRTVIYECHVKGMTVRHPQVDRELRGTYLGLASAPVVEHLHSLGVTAVELLPIHYFVTERRLAAMNLTNYWGYNSIGFFAPDPRYAARPGREIEEFKEMVRLLHAAGIEVILDVVYNHTAEGDHAGPTLSFRGIDNAAYYHLDPADRARYRDFSGCGNSLNASHPATRKLILDSLRYWACEMHVDGFRFDLAPVLCREAEGIDPGFELFSAIQNDPVLAATKLIVEGWDAAEDGFLLGRFPKGIAEWNCRYRDDVRRFWRGDEGCASRLATRLAGSSDIFDARSRTPLDGINYFACHDGFTLDDLVSFEQKHNDANGEDNRDGPSESFSKNWGVEGSTDDPSIRDLRERVTRNLWATLAFSRGVPMICAGDEFGRTQHGNNNAYCQDNDISWLDWRLDDVQQRRLTFVQHALRLRRDLPLFRADRFFTGQRVGVNGEHDVHWRTEGGHEMTEGDWNDAARRTLTLLLHQPAQRSSALSRDGSTDASAHSIPISLALLINGRADPCWFQLPRAANGGNWSQLLNTACDSPAPDPLDGLTVPAYSVVLLASREAIECERFQK